MSTFYLKIIASDRVFFEGQCQSLVLPLIDGEKEILAHHEKMAAAVEIGELRIKKEDGEVIRAAITSGIAEVVNNRVVVLAFSVELPEEIDIKRAEEAKERAEEQLRQRQSIQEHIVSQTALARATARLKEANRNHWNI